MAFRLPDKGYYLFSSIVPDVFGWIEVDGEPLEVYGATEAENKTIGYVEAKEGQHFVVRVAELRRVQPEADFTMQVFLDGTKADGVSIGRAAIEWDSPDIDSRWQHTFRGRPIGETTEQPFLFSKLQTTESDELACTKEEVVKNLGTIQLRYRRIKNVKPSTRSFKPKHTEPGPKIHERAKKARLSHQAAYGETVQISKSKRSTFVSIDPLSSPLFQVEFRYRSRQLLQLEGYIPNSPSPSPEPEQSPSPEPPVASTSSSNRSVSATLPSPAPQTEDAAERLARLEARFESLKRQEEMARLQMEIAALRGEVGESPTSSSSRKIKAEPFEDQRELKRVKQEIGEASFSPSSGSGNGKGKEKKKADVIVLSDSD